MRTALTSVDGIADIKTNPADNTCSFKAPADLDVKATLNKLAEDGNKHIKDWALDDAKKEEKKENKPKPNGDAQTVSLKLPNMT